jgi:DNA modification methylase
MNAAAPDPWRLRQTIGPATLYCGDANLILPVISRQFDPQAVACVMDPPYEFSASGGGAFRAARKALDQIVEQGLDQGFEVEILDRGGQQWCDSAVIFCHNDQGPVLWPALKARYERVVLCAWHKTNPMPVANKHYRPDLELYFYCWNKGAHPAGPLADLVRIWRGPVMRPQYQHPAQKPIGLMRKIISNVSAQIIIDPFMGTGTTGVAAIGGGRSFVGIEQNPEHFRTAVTRLQDAVKWSKPQENIKAPCAEDASTQGGQDGFELEGKADELDCNV